jgi:hypothetical protein
MLFAAVYLVVGVAFPNPSAADKNQFMWRLAAWVICAVAFAIHIVLEHLRFQNPAGRTAFHVAGSVALGRTGPRGRGEHPRSQRGDRKPDLLAWRSCSGH